MLDGSVLRRIPLPIIGMFASAIVSLSCQRPKQVRKRAKQVQVIESDKKTETDARVFMARRNGLRTGLPSRYSPNPNPQFIFGTRDNMVVSMLWSRSVRRRYLL